MRRQNILLLFIILIGLCGISMAFLVFYSWNKPLGPSLALPSYTPNTSQLAVSMPTSVEQGATTKTQIPGTTPPATGGLVTAQPAPTATQQPLCGGPRVMTLLVIGSDERSTGYMYGLADSIHVVRIDFGIPNLMMVDFPRDLWVEIPGISEHHGITHGKLNQAYLYGNPGMGYYDGPGEGPGLMARTLDLNFGLRVDHYLAIDGKTFIKMIDSVGGVDIWVDKPIDLSYGNDPSDPKYHLSAGLHHLDGKMTYILATNRIPSTFQRMEYQKVILSSLRKKMLTPEMLPKIPKLVAQFISSVQTDLSLSDINSLVCIAQAIPKENIMADSFPMELFTAGHIYDPNREVNTFIYKVDFDKLRTMVAEFMNGIWPMPKP